MPQARAKNNDKSAKLHRAEYSISLYKEPFREEVCLAKQQKLVGHS